MEVKPGGNALIYCQDAFKTLEGKTAHGLIRRSERFRIIAVIDSACGGGDAGVLLGQDPKGIPVLDSLEAALDYARDGRRPAEYLIVGLAPDGGCLRRQDRQFLLKALRSGLHLVSGLHDFLSEDEELAALAEKNSLTICDVRKPPPRNQLHFFSGKIKEVDSLKVAVLGTDSAVGKRTTAWLLVDALREAGFKTEFIGTGQTAWLQGAEYSLILDSLVNDFVTGEIEHAVWRAWQEQRPDIIVVEGQGSLLNPAYPGGFEILAAARPEAIILQHASWRREYDGLNGYPIHRLEKQVQAIELIGGRPVIAITLNSQNMTPEELDRESQSITDITGLIAVDPLREGVERLLPELKAVMAQKT